MEDGLAELGIPARLLEWLTGLLRYPLVRYSLTGISLESDSDDFPRARRILECTLLAEDLPTWLVRATDELPDVLAPLAGSLGGAPPTQHGLHEVMVLPGAEQVPCLVEWLGTGRSNASAYTAFLHVWQTASQQAGKLRAELAALPLAVDGPTSGDEKWAVNEVAARAGSDELQQIFPYLRLSAGGNYEPDFEVDVLRSSAVGLGTAAEEDSLFLRLSSGERRWLDEALATATRAAERFGREAEWMAALLPSVNLDELVQALEAVEPRLLDELREHGYSTAVAFLNFVQALRPALFQLGRRHVEAAHAPLEQASLLRRFPGLQDLVLPRPVIRLLDEPEVHLHPTALRRVLQLIQSMNRAGSSVLLPTHHAVFLSGDLGYLLHLHQTPEGVVLRSLGQQELQAQGALAQDLGWTRGELLARATFVLVVEGVADQLFLQQLHGEELREAGVLILRMHGTRNLLATAELDFVEQVLAPLSVCCSTTPSRHASMPAKRAPTRNAASLSSGRLCAGAGGVCGFSGCTVRM